MTVYYRLRAMFRNGGQSDEARILEKLVRQYGTASSFVEFGFHPHEYNCSKLPRDWRGLLIDGDSPMIRAARLLSPPNISIRHHWLTKDSLEPIEQFAASVGQLGVLSIDVDGNDYWLMDVLLGLRPEILIVEYNASFGDRDIAVPYDESFVRHHAHGSGWYHGASLVALDRRSNESDYGLVAIGEAGNNAFFLRRDLSTDATRFLDPATAYRECSLRNKWSGTNASQQWAAIEHLEFHEF